MTPGAIKHDRVLKIIKVYLIIIGESCTSILSLSKYALNLLKKSWFGIEDIRIKTKSNHWYWST